MKLKYILVLALAGIAASLASICQASDIGRWLIFVAQDESAIERKIADYIKEKHHVNAKYLWTGRDRNDLVLRYYWSAADRKSRIPVYVDTIISSRRNSDKRVTGRCIKIWSVYRLPESLLDEETVAEIKKKSEEFMRGYWVPHRIMLRNNDQLLFEFFINIPEPDTPIHPEMVYDALQRGLGSWRRYHSSVLRNIASAATERYNDEEGF